MLPCGYWIKNIKAVDGIVYFYVGVSGNNWSIVLKDANGNIEASKSGSSYGDHSLSAKTYGAHRLELNCSWKSASNNPCEVCAFDIPLFVTAEQLKAQQEQQALAAKLAAEKAAADAAAMVAAEAAAAEQLRLKNEMLASQTATWAANLQTDAAKLTAALPLPSLPENVTVTIIKSGDGTGQVLTSGGDNAFAERTSITVPKGYKIYCQAKPDANSSFVKWVSADGMEATANPIELPVTVPGSLTAVFKKTAVTTSTCAKEGEVKPLFGDCCPGLESKFSWETLKSTCVKPLENVTVTIIKSGDGTGQVLTSGGDNAFAERTSITVPKGYKIYCQAKPDANSSFVKWVSADGTEATANPIELPVTVPGSLTAVFKKTALSTTCQEGTTRTVKCPKNGKDVLQKCVGGAWVTVPGEEKKCEDTDYTVLAIIAVLIVVFFFAAIGKNK
jgi:hypothetical protein